MALTVAAVDQQCEVRQDLAAASTRTTALLGGNATRRMGMVRRLRVASSSGTVGERRVFLVPLLLSTRTTALLGGNATGRMVWCDFALPPAVDQQCAVRQDLAAASTRTTALLGGNATRRMGMVRQLRVASSTGTVHGRK